MGPLVLILAASIVSLSAGYDYGYELAPAALLYWDDDLRNFYLSEDEKSGMNSGKAYKTRSAQDKEAYPGYNAPQGCDDDHNLNKVDPEASQSSSARQKASNSEEELVQSPEAGKSDETELSSSDVVDPASTSVSAENAEIGAPYSEEISGEDTEGAASKEDVQSLESHEYQRPVRSVDG